MNCIIAKTLSGGKDLYYGIPNLEGATIVSSEGKNTEDYYETKLTIKTSEGSDFTLFIRQDK